MKIPSQIDYTRRLHYSRGTALIETTMVLSVLTLLLFGGLTMAIIGYQQITTDAGSFYAARAYAMALTAPTNSAVEQPADSQTAGAVANAVSNMLFPYIGKATFVKVPVASAGIAALPTSYYTQNARQGGVTLVTPQAQQAAITTQTAGIFSTGKPVSVPGVAMEPDAQIINPEFDLNGQNTYSNAVALQKNNAITKYFGTGMDTPPYFFGHNYMLYCTQLVTSSCTGSQLIFRAFGSAETLTSNNWSGNVTIKQSAGGSPNAFEAMLCHQRVYAEIAQQLFSPAKRPAYNNLKSVASNAVFEENPNQAPGSAWKQNPLNLVYAWDHQVNNGANINAASTVGTTPTQPLAGCQYVSY